MKSSAVATEAKDMDDDEVARLEANYWNMSAINSALGARLITATTGEVGTLVRRVLLGALLRLVGAEQMVTTKISLREKLIGELQRIITDWELQSGRPQKREMDNRHDRGRIRSRRNGPQL